jgi:hypothetical protein
MRKIKFLSLLAIAVLGTTVMYGQASRTWVSGVGDDANPCSRTAPCKTFAGAISKTAAGGEIDALDPGGFGALTITKAITIDGGGGQVASVLVAGTNGIVVQAGPSDVVILRNLRFNGIGSGLNGIRFLSGKDLNVENCFIFGFTQNGIDIALNQGTASSAHIINTVIKNNGGVGVRATNAVTPAVAVVVDSSFAILNNIGVEAAQHSHVTVSRTLVSKSAADGMKSDDAATSDAQLTVSFSDSNLNTNGVTAAPGGTANVAFSNIGLNTTCGLNNAGGTSFFTFGNNRLTGTGFCGTITPIPQQ